MFVRVMVFLYGVMSYALFLGTFAYAMAFVGGFLVPTTLDGEPSASLPAALVINMALLGLFALQHSVMARPAFKRWLNRFIPEAAERSTYVLMSSLALLLLFAFWEPLGGTLWNTEQPVLRGVLWVLFVAGWLTVLVTTFLINHFDLFGLRQVWLYLRKREYTALPFTAPGPYRIVRHPLYVGWLTAFWATPNMTSGHFFFAVLTTAYILVAIQFEERDLLDFHGQRYHDYRRRVPMLIPAFRADRHISTANISSPSAADRTGVASRTISS